MDSTDKEVDFPPTHTAERPPVHREPVGRSLRRKTGQFKLHFLTFDKVHSAGRLNLCELLMVEYPSLLPVVQVDARLLAAAQSFSPFVMSRGATDSQHGCRLANKSNVQLELANTGAKLGFL